MLIYQCIPAGFLFMPTSALSAPATWRACLWLKYSTFYMMTAATHGVQPEAHAVATFELDTEQVIAVDKGKLHGIMYGNISELV